MIRLLLTLAVLLAAASSSADQEEKPANTSPIVKTLEFNKHEVISDQCVASAALDYFQRGVEAQIETSIDTEDCDVASGTYVVKLTIRSDDGGESKVLDFEESWGRENDVPVESMRRYPIGDAVYLVKVRIRKLSCTCEE